MSSWKVLFNKLNLFSTLLCMDEYLITADFLFSCSVVLSKKLLLAALWMCLKGIIRVIWSEVEWGSYPQSVSVLPAVNGGQHGSTLQNQHEGCGNKIYFIQVFAMFFSTSSCCQTLFKAVTSLSWKGPNFIDKTCHFAQSTETLGDN